MRSFKMKYLAGFVGLIAFGYPALSMATSGVRGILYEQKLIMSPDATNNLCARVVSAKCGPEDASGVSKAVLTFEGDSTAYRTAYLCSSADLGKSIPTVITTLSFNVDSKYTYPSDAMSLKYVYKYPIQNTQMQVPSVGRYVAKAPAKCTYLVGVENSLNPNQVTYRYSSKSKTFLSPTGGTAYFGGFSGGTWSKVDDMTNYHYECKIGSYGCNVFYPYNPADPYVP